MSTLEHDDESGIRELLMGRRVVAAEQFTESVKMEGSYSLAEGKLTLDDGRELFIAPNEGCGGCPAGGYELDSLNRVDNIITRVDFEDEEGEPDEYGDGDEHTYRIFVLAGHERINLLSVSGDDGNGYYGTGYELIVRESAFRASQEGKPTKSENGG